jgi:hypothetical protein
VDEGVLAAVVRLDEAEAFFGIKPLYGSLRHGNYFLDTLKMLAGAGRRPSKSHFLAKC